VLAISLSLLCCTQSQVRLPALFTDHMVVQRGKPINVWGWDSPGQRVTVSLGGKSVSVSADSKGKFSASLPKLNAGGPYTLEVKGSSIAKVSDVLVGEVWICSGQSNMEWIVANSLFRDDTIKQADPNVRMFTVTKKVAQTPTEDVEGKWVASSANTIDTFSAVGLAFANKLHADLKVPIGMIHSSWGGTPAEAWTPRSIFSELTALPPDSLKRNMLETYQARLTAGESSYEAAFAKYRPLATAYQVKAFPQIFGDVDLNWTSAEFDDSSWNDIPAMPFAFDNDFDGGYYFRKEVILTQAQVDAASTLSLGAIDDFDRTFVNGTQIGQTDMTVPSNWSASRVYNIPKGLLKPGRNVIAVLAYDMSGPGGFSSPNAVFRLGSLAIGESWKFQKAKPYVPVPESETGPPPAMPEGRDNPNFPCTLYNGMIAALAPYSIQGAIWYQGESNADRAVQYTTLLSEMIRGWRESFGQGDFSFYTVQLANYMAPNPNQFDSAWAELRSAQDIVGQEPHGGTTTIIDIGEANDIHPRNKRDVGERLARIALKKDYGKSIEWQGPRIKSFSTKGDKITITFTHAKGLKTTDGQAPRCFAIAGADKQWRWATGTIQGETIVLNRSQGETMIRYAWQDNPPVNLINSDGLPAMPFRTDSLPLVTRNNR
jgi:sialate O-acetylesterase